jgi:hypothetical protein
MTGSPVITVTNVQVLVPLDEKTLTTEAVPNSSYLPIRRHRFVVHLTTLLSTSTVHGKLMSEEGFSMSSACYCTETSSRVNPNLEER